MARINPALFERLEQKFGLSRRRVYALIDEKVRATHLPGHLAAIVLASERGINISRFVSSEDLAEIRHAARGSAPPSGAVPSSSPTSLAGQVFLMIGLFWFLKLPF